jgi:hypothetical protein
VRDQLGDLGVYGRIILKWLLKKQGVSVWNGFSCSGQGPVNTVMNMQVSLTEIINMMCKYQLLKLLHYFLTSCQHFSSICAHSFLTCFFTFLTCSLHLILKSPQWSL